MAGDVDGGQIEDYILNSFFGENRRLNDRMAWRVYVKWGQGLLLLGLIPLLESNVCFVAYIYVI